MKSLKVLATVISLVLLSATSRAQAISVANPEANFSVQYMGVEDNYLCFVVTSNVNSNNSTLKIIDKAEGELYSQNWKLKSPYQFFKIEKKDGQQLIFNFKTGVKEIIKVFSTTTRSIENTVVEEKGLVVL